ncbi:protein obstructor-E-like isoform X1 [Amphibalanus amphitrite]|uniref:protein obstructor-E-like isoform X1 n=1 Tax=Amphibalanus amphitrite TaxID=1232801 RepID=UPI001C91967E|nr:protein obstructor-E-like isoform X1 [Amphibalanus amphitrite]
MKGLAVAVALLGLAHLGGAQRRGEGPAEQLDPCKEESGIAAHKDYCDRYLECSAGQVYEVDCPNGLVFAERGAALLDNCGYPNQNPYACLNKQLANPPISTEHCDWLYGIFGHETSCTRYWTCWNGTSTEQFCIGGLLYNEKTHSCDWPEFVADCQKHPLCAEDPNGNVPLGKSCERYWSCQGGYPRLMRCPATLVFDKVSRRCVHPPTEDCDVPPTESPEELGEEPPARQGGSPQRGRLPARGAAPPPPQQLDEPLYYDEEEFDPGFSSGPAEPAPQPSRPATLSRQPFRPNAGRPPLRGPAIPAGATPVN